MQSRIVTRRPVAPAGSYLGGYYGARGSYRVAGSSSVIVKLTLAAIQFKGINAIFQTLTWTPSGRIRFRCVDVTGAGANTVTTGWSVTGIADPAGVNIAGLMIVGNEYDLFYNLDTIPDVPGWNDSAFIDMGINWVQPAAGSPIDIPYTDP